MKKLISDQNLLNWRRYGKRGVGIVQTMVIGAVVATTGYFMTQQHSNQIVQFKNYSAKMEEDILMEQFDYVLSDTVACRQNFGLGAAAYQITSGTNTVFSSTIAPIKDEVIAYRNYADPNVKGAIPVYSTTAATNTQTTTRYYDVQKIELVPIVGQSYVSNAAANFTLRVTFQTFLRNDGSNGATNATRKVWIKEIPMSGSFDASRKITQCATAAAFSFANSICRAIKGQLGGAPSQVCLLDRLNIGNDYAAADSCNLNTAAAGINIPARYFNSLFNSGNIDKPYAVFSHRCFLEVLADLKDKYHGLPLRSSVEPNANESFIQKTGDFFASPIVTTGNVTINGDAVVGANGKFCLPNTNTCQNQWASSCSSGHAYGLSVSANDSGEVQCRSITAICDARLNDAALLAAASGLCRCSWLRLPDGCGRSPGVLIMGTRNCGGHLVGTNCVLD